MLMMIEIAHWSALAPLAYLAVFRRSAPMAYWLVAAGFGCSFVGDTAAQIMGGSWAAEPYYLTAQYGLFLVALFAEGAGQMVPALVMYVGVGTVLYLGMVQYQSEPEPYTNFMRWWYPYQFSRFAAFGLFGWAAWRTKGKG